MKREIDHQENALKFAIPTSISLQYRTHSRFSSLGSFWLGEWSRAASSEFFQACLHCNSGGNDQCQLKARVPQRIWQRNPLGNQWGNSNRISLGYLCSARPFLHSIVTPLLLWLQCEFCIFVRVYEVQREIYHDFKDLPLSLCLFFFHSLRFSSVIRVLIKERDCRYHIKMVGRHFPVYWH